MAGLVVSVAAVTMTIACVVEVGREVPRDNARR
jgi:hypothetical protein